MKHLLPTPAFLAALALFAGLSASAPAFAADVADHDIVWDSASADARGAMPIGNGDIGLNAWVEPSGDLCFFIGKTDSWDENLRLLKLNKVRVKFTPALDVKKDFRWELKLREGAILIHDGRTEVRVWVDANHPVVQVDAKSLGGEPIAASVALEPWRTKERGLSAPAGPSKRTEEFSTGYTTLPYLFRPDTVLPHGARQIGWNHRNVVSPWLPSLQLQKLEAIAQTQKDPLMNLTMGGIVRGDGMVPVSDLEIRSEKPAPSLSVRVHVLTQATDTPEQWLAALEKQADAVEALPPAARLAEHARWWSQFWDRSWIFVEGKEPAKGKRPDPQPALVSRAYTLQRWMNACSGRGAMPLKFNGSIFTVDDPTGQPFQRGIPHHDADYRAWGGCYWWQNTRFAYWSMLESGDFDMMRPIFDMYMKALPLRKLATKTYYGHDGAFYWETQPFWGTCIDHGSLGYGTDRKGKPDGQTDNTYVRRYWQGGLELSAIMLDYYEITRDKKFLEETLVPFVGEIVTFYDQHWKRGADGKIRFDPAQSLETWHSAVNPTPEIAGLLHVIPRLQAATGSKVFQKTLDDLPPVPLSPDGKRILPAEKYSNKKNLENPELYAVFPYRIHALTNGDAARDIGRNTFAVRKFRDAGCWNQHAIQAALLGLANEARANVVANASGSARSFRFPAMWGPGWDWMPDQDHGCVTMTALQRMLMQCEGDRIVLLPAWPKDWNASFKLHAPKNTVVEARVENGEIKDLKVTPESRRKDVEVKPAQ